MYASANFVHEVFELSGFLSKRIFVPGAILKVAHGTKKVSPEIVIVPLQFSDCKCNPDTLALLTDLEKNARTERISTIIKMRPRKKNKAFLITVSSISIFNYDSHTLL